MTVEKEVTEPPSCVLMVEADILVRQPISAYLRECGYRVLEASNTDEAVLLVQQSGVAIDIVLADVKAPGTLDGFALSRWLRLNHHGMKVILVGSVASEAKEAGQLCEEGPHLSKPYDPQQLLDHVRRLLAARERNPRQ
jgi:DNA-binding response OmpR family regulator